MDKAELIRHEIEKRRVHNLAIGNPLFAAMAEEDIELLSFIDSLQEEPISEDLEEASKNYALNNTPWDDCKDEIQESFKAGAKWQKEQEYTCYEEAFEDGAKWKVEQMMAKAADMVVGYWMSNGLMLTVDETENCYNIDEGDKVKVIIIKEN